MKIDNANVFMPGGEFQKRSVCFSDTIESVESGSGGGLDARGLYLVPGFLDIHSHGAMDRDASDGGAGDLQVLSHYYAAHGVTGFLATTMTLKEPELTVAMKAVAGFEREEGARCLGVNLEGPFLSYAKRGAQNSDNLHAPEREMFRRLYKASGESIRLVTVAPEEPGAMEFIKDVSALCTVSVGHSEADYDTAMAAYAAGAAHATHLFNGMPPLHHRKPGVIGAAMDSGATAELICDGLHIHPSAIRAAFAMFPGRICLISDSLRCAGMPDGDYTLGGLPITLSGGVARLGDGTIAGSAISLHDAVKNCAAFGIPLEAVIAAATSVPARAIGLEGKYGSIVPGAAADLLLLDRELNIKKIYIAGREQAV